MGVTAPSGKSWRVPAGTRVWPVMVAPSAKLWAGPPVITNQPSEYAEIRNLPTDGSFRTFLDRNDTGHSEFSIFIFTRPKIVRGVQVIGCVINGNPTQYLLL